MPANKKQALEKDKATLISIVKEMTESTTGILETEVILSDNMGVVCTIQKVEILFQNDIGKTLLVRETDCFKKINGNWVLVHQHASVPSGGEWDGKIIV
jgi:hypothetical protein